MFYTWSFPSEDVAMWALILRYHEKLLAVVRKVGRKENSILVLLMPWGILRMCFQTCLASSDSFKGFWNFFVLGQVFCVAEGRLILMNKWRETVYGVSFGGARACNMSWRSLCYLSKDHRPPARITDLHDCLTPCRIGFGPEAVGTGKLMGVFIIESVWTLGTLCLLY